MAARVQNMTEGKPLRLILAFSLPLMIGNVFQQLYTVVDTMVVGQALGVGALAGAGGGGLAELDDSGNHSGLYPGLFHKNVP